MFLPMSWTSPLTVAIRMLPWAEEAPVTRFSSSMYGRRYATAFFIARALLTTCGRNILPAPKRSPTTFMPSISGPSMIRSGSGYCWRASSTSASMKSTMPCTSACDSRAFDRRVAPGQIGLALLAAALDLLGELHHPLGRVRPPVEDDVLDVLEQVLRDVLVDDELAGVDDPHVHAGLDRVIQEGRVNRLADDVVAAEGERQVADAAADLHAGQRRLDDPRGLDVVDRVVVVLLEPGRNREDVRVEDDVGRLEAGLLDEQLVGALADLDLALDRVGLSRLVERHDDDAGAVAADVRALCEEVRLPFLQADRVDDALALDALQAGLEDRPARAVDHHRHARDLRLGRDVVQERRHGLLGVEHAFVHVDVDHVGAAADLLDRDADGLGVVAALDEPRELRGAGDVGPLADHLEVALGTDRQDFEAGELGELSGFGTRDAGSVGSPRAVSDPGCRMPDAGVSHDPAGNGRGATPQPPRAMAVM